MAIVKILVCVKYVPDPDHIVIRTGMDGNAELDDISGYRMNRFDEFAVEEALRMKEAKKDMVIDVVTVGPPRSIEALRRAMGMGAGNGIHIDTRTDRYMSPLITAAAIADYARGRKYAMILTGAMSEDMGNGQVGPMVAALLDLPCATQVISARPADKGVEKICVAREIEGGAREMLEITLPAVLSVQSGINEPRYPSLSNLLRANKQEIESIVLKIDDNERQRSSEVMVSMVMPKKVRAGRHLDGTAVEKAEQLVSILDGKAFFKTPAGINNEEPG